MMTDTEKNLVAAAKQVLWKLSHNHNIPSIDGVSAPAGFVHGYTGPATVTREDVTVRMLSDAVAAIEARR